MSSYRDLEVWRKAMDMVAMCYEVTQNFPKHELYGLTNQLRRAAVSVPANIAEGQARQHVAEFIQFLHIARGSLAELEMHLLLSVRLGYTEPSKLEPILTETIDISKMLGGLCKSLETKRTK